MRYYSLVDKVVWITGASSGIGRACAVAYYRAGARVVVSARSEAPLRELAEELGVDRVAPLPLDVTDPEARRRGMAEARDRFGRVDVLVNNAGWAGFGSLLNQSDETIERMARLNVEAPIALTRLVLPDMIERGSGQIVNVASVVGYQAMPRMSFYGATKAALLSFSTGLRLEVERHGIDVLTVAPGSTRTDFFTHAQVANVRVVRPSLAQAAPERVAEAIVAASRRRRREVVLGAAGKTLTLIRRCSHRGADALMTRLARYSMPSID